MHKKILKISGVIFVQNKDNNLNISLKNDLGEEIYTEGTASYIARHVGTFRWRFKL